MENSSNLPGNLSMQEVLRMAATPAGQQLIALLRQKSSDAFQSAMSSAAAGDYTQAKQAIEKMMTDPKAQKLLEQLRR
jgi:hypothetical protein